MAKTSVIEVYETALRMDISLLVRSLNAELGAPTVAALAGSRDSKLPYKWAKGTKPNTPAETRLRVAHRVWNLIATNESPDIARAWFQGASPLLDETPPIQAISEDRLREVNLAAQAFVDCPSPS